MKTKLFVYLFLTRQHIHLIFKTHSVCKKISTKNIHFLRSKMSLTAFFPTECLEYIFDHLKCPELLKCTEVCPEWNDFIGTTRSCMKKIFFKVSFNQKETQNGPSTNVLGLYETPRKYESVRFEIYNSEVEKILLEKGAPKWTSVQTYAVEFYTLSRFLGFLRIFQSSVTKFVSKLSYFGGIEEEVDFPATNLEFP